uniref:Uncharacterized protein n=1 Tax=Hyaloperonospora arabidopsidis (strain Emoy2) TaxID=559515 RepID=M4BVQ1_HYAAE
MGICTRRLYELVDGYMYKEVVRDDGWLYIQVGRTSWSYVIRTVAITQKRTFQANVRSTIKDGLQSKTDTGFTRAQRRPSATDPI